MRNLSILLSREGYKSRETRLQQSCLSIIWQTTSLLALLSLASTATAATTGTYKFDNAGGGSTNAETIQGGSSCNAPADGKTPLKLEASISGNTTSFIVSKQDGTSFLYNGNMDITVGSYEDAAYVPIRAPSVRIIASQNVKEVVVGTHNLDSFNLENVIASDGTWYGGYPKSFYARYKFYNPTLNQNLCLWAGPVIISKTGSTSTTSGTSGTTSSTGSTPTNQTTTQNTTVANIYPVITSHETGNLTIDALTGSVSLRFNLTGFFNLERSTDQTNYSKVYCNDGSQGIGVIDDNGIELGKNYWYRVRMSTQPVSCSSDNGWSNPSPAYQVIMPTAIVKFMLYYPTNGKITGYVGDKIVNCGGTGNDCQINATINTPVNLNAEASNGYSFNGWNGCPTNSISSNCGFNLTQQTEMGVNFISQLQPPTTVQQPNVTTQSPASSITSGMVAYYCFDDANNLGKDCSGNNNSGTTSGGVSASAGINGGAATFGGATKPGSIRVPNSTSLQFQDLTVGYFVKLTSEAGMNGYGVASETGAAHAIFAKDHDRGGLWSLLSSSSGQVSAGLGSNSFMNPKPSLGAAKEYSVAQNWLHVAFVLSSKDNTVQEYLNGELVKIESNKTIDMSVANTKDLYLGKYSDYWYPLNGMLDEVRFYNRVLSADEIKQLATMQTATPAPQQATLTVTMPANGSVSSDKITCGTACIADYALNTPVTLTAHPASQDFAVNAWQGCDTVSADKLNCQVTMNGAKNVNVTFSKVVTTTSLTVTTPTDGSISNDKINCGTTCTADYVLNTPITLTAHPASQDFAVSAWQGCDTVSTDKLSCQVTMNGAKNVSVTFSKVPATTSGSGSTVTNQPQIPKTTDCDPVYDTKSKSLMVYVAAPLQNSVNGADTGIYNMFKATLKMPYNKTDRFIASTVVVADPLPKVECQPEIAIITTNGGVKLHIPHVVVPEYSTVLGKQVQTGNALYEVDLKWMEADKNFMLETVKRLP